MPVQIPDPKQWLRDCASASPELLQRFVLALRRDFINPTLAVYHQANKRIACAPVRHVARTAYYDRTSTPSKLSTDVAQFKRDRAERREAQNQLQVLIRTERLAKLRLEFLKAQSAKRRQRQPDNPSAFAEYLLHHARRQSSRPEPLTRPNIHSLRMAQNLTADKAAVAQEVLVAFPDLFGVVALAPTPEETRARAKSKLYLKLRAAVSLDTQELALLNDIFDRR